MTFRRRCLIEARLRVGCTTRAAATTAAITKELKLFEHYAHPAALFLGVLVLPLVELESTLDEERASLRAILRDRFALFAPRFDVYEDHLLAAFAGLHLKLAVDREAELANRRPLRRHAQLGVAREIAHKENLV